MQKFQFLLLNVDLRSLMMSHWSNIFLAYIAYIDAMEEDPSIFPLDQDYYLTWLDEQPKKSVKFLWVARDNSTWVQEIVGEDGLVVPWCEQLKVLCHPSIGGFLTHCGWNSTLEAVYAGIPMLTLPICSDQDVDSRKVQL
ncbi:UDP-glycosyltransferase 87A2-like protein [Carex littledalei]|uniref:UDP-glycosyltransferase 87A2-like protein n=1 Tax=Carex littledalei TaxID=544730 RepID=A0A833RUX1_9POAL|nr:UDP-glycosyltransferase 87A2-like protein [Carex littledalei]